MPPFRTVFIRVEVKGVEPYVARHAAIGNRTDEQVERSLNRVAKNRGFDGTYKVVPESEFREYRAMVTRALNDKAPFSTLKGH